MKSEKIKMIVGKPLAISLAGISLALFAVTPAFAHVIVHPDQVGIAAFQEFSMSVPSEKDMPTVAVTLKIPSGLQEVTPNVKPGWTITEKKNGDNVTEIDWTGGSIPSGQRDNFLFQAQVPPKPMTLQWKAYQTYSDGTVVAWDHAPTNNPDDDSAPPPYSQTKVVNDLQPTPAPTSQTSGNDTTALAFSIVAIALSGMSFLMQQRKSK